MLNPNPVDVKQSVVQTDCYSVLCSASANSLSIDLALDPLLSSSRHRTCESLWVAGLLFSRSARLGNEPDSGIPESCRSISEASESLTILKPYAVHMRFNLLQLLLLEALQYSQSESGWEPECSGNSIRCGRTKSKRHRAESARGADVDGTAGNLLNSSREPVRWRAVNDWADTFNP